MSSDSGAPMEPETPQIAKCMSQMQQAKQSLLNGDFQTARAHLENYAKCSGTALIQNFDLLNEFTEVSFVARAFSALSIFTEVSFGVPIEVTLEKGIFDGLGVTRWVLCRNRPMVFIFDEAMYKHPYLSVLLKHWIHGLRMYCHFAQRNPWVEGSICISLEDMGVVPGICFSDFRPEYSLLPDPIFMGSNGYISVKESFDNSGIKWADRRPVAIWRGSTTGWFDTSGLRVTDWRSLPRIRLCTLGKGEQSESRDLDAGITAAIQIAEGYDKEIEGLGISRPFMALKDFQRFKFQVDIDGNSCAWPGLLTKLCSGSVVFKVLSPVGFRQWFYDRLIPWINYVPVSADMSDLLDKIAWLKQRDELAQLIGANGRQLTVEMTPANETLLSERAILQAFQSQSLTDA